MTNIVIDWKFIRYICRLYGDSKSYVTMKIVGKKNGLTKTDVIKIIQYAICNNIVSDELIEKIILKVKINSNNSPEISKIYEKCLQLKESSKEMPIDEYHVYLSNNIDELAHLLSIYDESYTDDYEISKATLEYKLNSLLSTLSQYENYLYNEFTLV